MLQEFPRTWHANASIINDTHVAWLLWYAQSQLLQRSSLEMVVPSLSWTKSDLLLHFAAVQLCVLI